MIENYSDFLQEKRLIVAPTGKEPWLFHPQLYPFQWALVRWTVRRGRGAVFADCGLGKTFMQLSYAANIGGIGLIVCPLSVAQQTIEHGKMIEVDVDWCENQPTKPGLYITNYEKLKRFSSQGLDCLVLDESSILKSMDGKTRTRLIKDFANVPYRFCFTATPAPNDISELGNHAEFLGICTRAEMLAQFFVHESSSSQEWRLKGHAQDAFWEWVASWAVYLRKPSDVGDYDDSLFVLPALNIEEIKVQVSYTLEGELFARLPHGITGRADARKKTLDDRVKKAAEIIQSNPGQWVVWCGLNNEGRALHRLLSDSCLIEGSTSDDQKVLLENSWRMGEIQTLISKSSIFGFGVNWQHCHNVLYLGLDDSFERWYQSIRRCWRFGQKESVHAVIVTSEAESQIVRNIQRKERNIKQLIDGVVTMMQKKQTESVQSSVQSMQSQSAAREDEQHGENWRLLLGDSVQRMPEVADSSVSLSVFSPPFASLYTYSNLENDMGNSTSYEEFFRHFDYLVPELLRITKPARRACVHVQQIARTLLKDGVIGWYDYRADVVSHFVSCGWIYDGEIVIDKDPQAQAIRTKSKALMFVQKNKDSVWSRPAMADYILLFRAPGDNPTPIVPNVTNEEWIKWARPIWYDIKESNTLNAAVAREEKDERHICPLQLETIERCIRLWSCPGEMVFDPFAGIGSTGYVALQQERCFLGIELKESYWRTAINNLRQATKQESLFDSQVSA